MAPRISGPASTPLRSFSAALRAELSESEQKAQAAAVGAERAAELEAQLEETRTQAEALRGELAESEQKAQANAADAERAGELERELEDARATLADARVKLDDARAQRSRVPELEAELAGQAGALSERAGA